MQIEMYIFLEIVLIVLFIFAFFTKQELLWILSLLLSGILAFTSYSVEYYLYKFNVSRNDYQLFTVSNSYPYLVAINLAFFALTLLLLIFDIWEKYGPSSSGGRK